MTLVVGTRDLCCKMYMISAVDSVRIMPPCLVDCFPWTRPVSSGLRPASVQGEPFPGQSELEHDGRIISREISGLRHPCSLALLSLLGAWYHRILGWQKLECKRGHYTNLLTGL